jgi:hypothetical protein
MPHFLAIYTMTSQALARFRALPPTEQQAIDTAGLSQWKAWEQRHSDRLGDGAMVGRTIRVSRDGTADASNAICGYVIVEADSIADAARLFEGHPHFATFPGDAVDIMPFVTAPRSPGKATDLHP